jgi:hypothetical protein
VQLTRLSGTTHWGYRFTVTPLRMRLDDAAALTVRSTRRVVWRACACVCVMCATQARNPALAYWLLELLLSTPVALSALATHRGGALVALAETLLWFVTTAESSARARQRDRAVRLLARVLRAVSAHAIGAVRRRREVAVVTVRGDAGATSGGASVCAHCDTARLLRARARA